MKKFLIINPFGIGDILFTTPVVRAIKENFPEAEVSYWSNQRVACLLRNNPYIKEVFPFSRGDLKKVFEKSSLEGIRRFLNLLRNIKNRHFDISLDLSLDYRYSLISQLLGIERRIGFNYKKRGRFLTDRIEIQGYHSKHAVEYYLDLLECIEVKPKSSNLELNIPESAKIKSKRLLSLAGVDEKDLIIGVVPGAGASWGKDAVLKHWPPIRFAQLSDRIIEELGGKILILGDETEKPIAEIIVNMMKHKPIDLVGKTSLEELSGLINFSHILITNDGGPLHIAVALGVKTVSIFGPVDDSVYGPYPCNQNHIVLKCNISCRPCYRNFRMPVCDKDRECIKSISTQEVFEAVRRLLPNASYCVN